MRNLLEKLTFVYLRICCQNISPLILSSIIILEKKGKKLRKFLQKNTLQTGNKKALYFSLEREAKMLSEKNWNRKKQSQKGRHRDQ